MDATDGVQIIWCHPKGVKGCHMTVGMELMGTTLKLNKSRNMDHKSIKNDVFTFEPGVLFFYPPSSNHENWKSVLAP